MKFFGHDNNAAKRSNGINALKQVFKEEFGCELSYSEQNYALGAIDAIQAAEGKGMQCIENITLMDNVDKFRTSVNCHRGKMDALCGVLLATCCKSNGTLNPKRQASAEIVAVCKQRYC